MTDENGVVVGSCVLCGQKMIRDGAECWHPWDVSKACPPEPSVRPYDAQGWAAFHAAGLRCGRPGVEHFRPEEAPRVTA